MLLIVTLSAKSDTFPVEALDKADAAVANVGFRKEVRSVLKPGKEFSVTYEGPNMDKNQIENILKPIADDYGITFSIEVEESVRFP
jgi:hypothetical protein